MTALDAARKVVAEKQCALIRPRKDAPNEYDFKEAFQGKKKGWFYLDLFSASAIAKVYDAINESNQAKLAALPIQRIASICFQMVK
jgi:hypothetical protein